MSEHLFPPFFENIFTQYKTYANYRLKHPFHTDFSKKRQHIDDIYRQNQAYHQSLIVDDETSYNILNNDESINDKSINYDIFASNFSILKINKGIIKILNELLTDKIKGQVCLYCIERINENVVSRWLMNSSCIEFLLCLRNFGIDFKTIEITNQHLISDSYFYCDFSKYNDEQMITIYLYYEKS